MIPSDKVQNIINKHDSLEKELSAGEFDAKQFAKKSKEYSDLKNIIKIAREYLNYNKNKEDLKNIIDDKKNDSEIIDLAQKELDSAEDKKNLYEKKLKLFLLPKDRDDEKNAIVEIRAGTGGLEATLFASDLFKMYEKVCSKKKMEDRNN